ncbi:MAG: RNA repair domain-containing protein [Candidatus Nezhaarchaeota archaeon]|nr:RNA repair domain-containing protein [Candidatus Nezhaarchaeota archaeon]
MATARGAINKLKWTRGLSKCVILVRHRGAPGDVRELKGEFVKEVGKDHLVYIEEGVEVYIPYHRVLEVRDAEKRVVFKREGAWSNPSPP